MATTKKKARRMKKNSQMRRTVFGTVSLMLMLSAIIVALIPVPKSKAAAEEPTFEYMVSPKITEATADPEGVGYMPNYLGSATGSVEYGLNPNYPLYYSGDGNFLVAYGNEVNGPNKVGTIVYYNVTNRTTTLEIPNEMIAYEKFGSKFFATNEQNQMLYYLAQDFGPSEAGYSNRVYAPCTYDSEDEWRDMSTFYVLTDDSDGLVHEVVSGNTIPLIVSDVIRMPIRFIGSTRYDFQKMKYVADNVGVFEGATDITSLIIPENTIAIGNNAFRECGFSSMTIKNGVWSIGNHAFENCIQLANVTFEIPSGADGNNSTSLKEIGDYAFAGCGKLASSIVLPSSVKKIGNYCFLDSGLPAIDMVGEDGITWLEYIGDGAFANCKKLGQLKLPNGVKNIDKVHYLVYGCQALTNLVLPDNTLPSAGTSPNPPADNRDGQSIFQYDNVTGCKSLDTVVVANRNIKLDCDCTVADDCTDPSCSHASCNVSKRDNTFGGASGSHCMFSKENLGGGVDDDYMVSDEFCVYAYDASAAANYAKYHELAIGYLDDNKQGWYAKLVKDYLFTADENGNLVRIQAEPGVDGKNVIIPNSIAKYHILTIDSNTFGNVGDPSNANKSIEFIYLPRSVATIQPNAFYGCENLQTVMFEDALTVSSIGADAFKTLPTTERDLRFVGTISDTSQPYLYAMNLNNNYNDPSAVTQYIKCCSQFPTNMQVELVVEKDPDTMQIKSVVPTLVAVPTLDQYANSLDPAKSYSITAYSGASDKHLRTKEEENNLVNSSYLKYQNGQTMTEDEEAIYNAVFNPVIPSGIYAMDPDLYKGQEIKSIELKTIKDVPDDAFAGCKNLKDFKMDSVGTINGQEIHESLGDYVFDGCEKLDNVILPSSLNQMGLVPFRDCTSLTDVEFGGSPYFDCPDESAIIYKKDQGGNLSTIVECLATRGKNVGSSEITEEDAMGVKEIMPEAFMNCPSVTAADLTISEIVTVPESCFRNDKKLSSVKLPTTTETIDNYAFMNTGLGKVAVPNSVSIMEPSAFQRDVDESGNAISPPEIDPSIIVECEADSVARKQCDKYGIRWTEKVPVYTVTFYQEDGVTMIGKPQEVPKFEDAICPFYQVVGYTVNWIGNYKNVQGDVKDIKVVAELRKLPPGAVIVDETGVVWVLFVDPDTDAIYDRMEIELGKNIPETQSKPEKPGYFFIGWDPDDYYEDPVENNKIIYAKFFKDPNYTGEEPSGNGTIDPSVMYTVTFADYDGTVLQTQQVAKGDKTKEIDLVPTRKGYTFTSWSPMNYTELPVYGDFTITALYQKGAPGDVDSSDYSGNVSVDSGSASGGKNPDSNVSAEGGAIENSNNGSGSGSNNNGSSNGTDANQGGNDKADSNKKPASSGGGSATGSSPTVSQNTSDRTKVEVSKTGISNKDLVSASVEGSNDNFVIKITDSEEAKAAVEKALLGAYGTLDNLKYFAMDISLYDSTGLTKITDTTGLKIRITMPIPDAMAGYAGNNKAGSVKDGEWERLNARLLTIDNVPCISFETTHFSPYAIYVETDHLTADGVSDASPKTGDPIHPKWFLSIGLALLSILMFMMKGSKNKIVKVIE